MPLVNHIDIGTDAIARQRKLRQLIAAGKIKWAGYRPGKIYGTLSCSSGKKMSLQNRVFFSTEQEAIEAGYRPCGHCLREKYREWKLAQ